MNEEDKKINIGDLYSVNKTLVEKYEKPLSNSKIRESINVVTRFMAKVNQNYYMLLCHERRDYTIFKTDCTVDGNKYNAEVMLKEVAANRGQIKSIELTEAEDAIEIWISIPVEVEEPVISFNADTGEEVERMENIIKNESFCYMFFGCDPFVIDEV